MKHARYQGLHIEAAPGAPVRAICPDCEHPVTLRSRKGQFGAPDAYFYRHVRGAPSGCSQRPRRLAYPPAIPAVPTASFYKLEKAANWYNVLVETGFMRCFRVTRTWGGKFVKVRTVITEHGSFIDAEGEAQKHVMRMIKKGYELEEWW